MDFRYSFTINSRPAKRGEVRLPLQNNMVVFGQFRPDAILNKNVQHPAVVGMVHYESADEFRNDCSVMINYVNRNITISDLAPSFNKALKLVVKDHVLRCGRVFINDLMSYIDTYSELLLAMGIDKKTLADQYPIILYIMVQEYSNYVLEAFNTIDGRNLPFTNSPRYVNLRNYISIKMPQLIR